MAETAGLIPVELVAALPDRQQLYRFEVPAGTLAIEAVERCGVLADFPELADQPLQLGIFGRKVEAGQVLVAGDRVEIYRPLSLDPMEARRRRAS